MWYRYDLKNRAKMCLRKYYWMAFLTSLIVGILGGGENTGVNIGTSWKSRVNQGASYQMPLSEENIGIFWSIFAIMMIIFLVIFLLALFFGIFVGGPMSVGGRRYYMESRVIQRSAGIEKAFYAFKCGSYLNIVKVLFLRNLFVFLWSLLLIVPGIIKAYEYYMVPYILSENPDMQYKEALALSKEMMMGNKWSVFVLELSFMGWRILGMLTCGLGIPFIQPYIDATFAELYAVLRSHVGYTGLRGFGIPEEEEYADIVSEQ